MGDPASLRDMPRAEPDTTEPSSLPPLKYAGGALDRAGAERRDPAWVAAQRADPAARVIPLWRGRVLVDDVETDHPRAALRELASIDAACADARIALLGLDRNGAALFAAELGDLPEESLGGIIGNGSFVNLRHVGPALSHDQAALLGYAHGLMAWHRRARFCGECGAPTTMDEGGYVRCCTGAECSAHVYPRTDPAVIMLVVHPASGDAPARCLLASHGRLPGGMYSTLAGFVEPGESLEEAVAREVREETGVEIDGARYVGSQPWPFPSSLMIGFRASATTEAIRIDPGELQEARWFTAREVAAFGDSSDDAAAFRLPRADSIARWLVDSWVAEQLAASDGGER